MFEVGKTYMITMTTAIPGDWTDEISVWTVTEIDGPLIKLGNGGGREKIVNTGSWNFACAELVG